MPDRQRGAGSLRVPGFGVDAVDTTATGDMCEGAFAAALVRPQKARCFYWRHGTSKSRTIPSASSPDPWSRRKVDDRGTSCRPEVMSRWKLAEVRQSEQRMELDDGRRRQGERQMVRLKGRKRLLGLKGPYRHRAASPF